MWPVRPVPRVYGSRAKKAARWRRGAAWCVLVVLLLVRGGGVWSRSKNGYPARDRERRRRAARARGRPAGPRMRCILCF